MALLSKFPSFYLDSSPHHDAHQTVPPFHGERIHFPVKFTGSNSFRIHDVRADRLVVWIVHAIFIQFRQRSVQCLKLQHRSTAKSVKFILCNFRPFSESIWSTDNVTVLNCCLLSFLE